MNFKVISFAVVLLVAGCGGGGSSGDGSAVAPETTVASLAKGKAHLSSPVVGETVKILDATGHAFAQEGPPRVRSTGIQFQNFHHARLADR